MLFDLIVRNGSVVWPNVSALADVAVRGGLIAAIGDLKGATAATEVDARGLTVFPGGVDPHTHVRWPFLDATTRDDFASASIAALYGGTTCMIDWALPVDDSAVEGLQRRRAVALDDGVILDFGLHSVLKPTLTRGTAEMADVVALGAPTFKCYMTYRKRGLLTDAGFLRAALSQAKDIGAIVGVHAESPTLHERAEEEFRAAGLTEAIHFRMAKDNIVEEEAVRRAILLAEATGSSLMIQHVSTRQGATAIREGQRRGVSVLGEASPHYLALTDDVYRTPDGRRFICSPPIKSQADQDALWEAVADGTLSIVGADHASFSLADKAMGETAFDVPNGLPGVETRFPLLYSMGVAEGRLSEGRFCEVIAENPARVAGIFPQKGVIAVGSDADLTLVDPAQRRTIRASDLHHPVDWTPYEGVEVKGWPVTTILRGDVVVRNGNYVPPRTPGRFLAGNPRGFLGVR